MTENTQTTAERIATLINEGIDCSCDGGWTNESLLGVLSVAQTIAAEIDRLTAERDVARAHNAELSTELAGANFEGNLAMIQRDEAYVVLKKRTAERDEARAEVDRLRPAAEAWEAWREFDELVAKMPLTRDTEQEQAVQDAATKRSAAYARARAAKGEK